MARHGIALISDEIEYAVNTGMKSGMIDVKKNTVVTVIEKNGLQEAGGASHIIFGGEYADMMMLGSRDSLLCTELEVTLPTDNSYKWLLFVACYCFPFMHTLTLNRDTPATHSRVVNGPLFARSLERMLRFDNFPSLRRIVVKSVCCVLFEW